MRWRTYLLLEVVIAMALVAAVAPFIMKGCFAAAHHKCHLARDLRSAREAQVALHTIKQMLYEGQIDWRKMYSGHSVDGVLSEPACNYTISVVKSKYKRPTATQPSSTWRLLEIAIDFGAASYVYKVRAQRLSPRKSN